jgi:cell division protein FtsB
MSSSEIKSLEAKFAALEARNNALEARVVFLESQAASTGAATARFHASGAATPGLDASGGDVEQAVQQQQQQQQQLHDETNKFQVTVNGLMNRKFTLDVESGTHICELKDMISKKSGQSQRSQVLVFGGKRLTCCSDGTPSGEGHSNPPAPCNKTCPTLQHYSIQSASVLSLGLSM